MRLSKNIKKPAWFLLGLIIVLLVTGLFGLRQCQSSAVKSKPASLVFVFDCSPQEQASLHRLLGRFQSLYPHIKVSLNASASDNQTVDVLAGLAYQFPSQTVSGASNNEYSLVPWSGQVWTLAARRSAVDAAARELESQVKALRAGSATPDDFRLLLDWFGRQNISPITLGNSHKWPFLLWLQHWAAATAGPSTVVTLPKLAESSNGYASLRPAFEELKEWRNRGWFYLPVWEEGWARGLMPLNEGKAVFALVSAAYLSPIPESSRADLEFLPFPRRRQDAAWSVGSATYLGVLPGASSVEAAALLVRFLTSPGVTAELTRDNGLPYFAWDPKTFGLPMVIPSWLETAATAEFDALARFFDPRQ